MKMMNSIRIYMLLALLLLVGCSRQKPEEIRIYEMNSFSEVNEDSLILITDTQAITIFYKAFISAVKQQGIVDIMAPDYKVIMEDASYFLWISPDYGTIMNTDDTHTIYTIAKESIDKIYNLQK